MRRERGTAVVQARLDIRDLATIAQYDKFKHITTKARLVSTVVELFADLLIAQEKVLKRVESTVDAIDVLERIGISFKGEKGMYGLKLTRALQKEALQEEGFDVGYMESTLTKSETSKLKGVVSQDEIDRAVKLYRSDDLKVHDLSSPPAPVESSNGDKSK